MVNKPEYRFKFQIIDDTSGAVVQSGNYSADDKTDLEGEVSIVLRQFFGTTRRTYEEQNYEAPLEDEE